MCMCFVDIEKGLIIVLKRVLEWALRKTGITEVLCESVMNLYD